MWCKAFSRMRHFCGEHNFLYFSLCLSFTRSNIVYNNLALSQNVISRTDDDRATKDCIPPYSDSVAFFAIAFHLSLRHFFIDCYHFPLSVDLYHVQCTSISMFMRRLDMGFNETPQWMRWMKKERTNHLWYVHEISKHFQAIITLSSFRFPSRFCTDFSQLNSQNRFYSMGSLQCHSMCFSQNNKSH